jgi:serine/threonine protein kinase
VESSNEALSNIPEIPSSEVSFIDRNPIAMGSYSEVFLCRWNNQKVAVKRLRIDQKSNQMKSLKLETSLAISFFHPNVVKIFGSLKMENGMLGIVMEWADQGSLIEKMKSLSFSQKVRVSLCICDGLAYLHSKKVAHRDLKPENILLFGSEPLAKISDFGTSKVIQTMITNTSMAGTPKYSAPELLDVGLKCGKPVDVFSLAIILYELFSGLDAFPGCQTVVQVVAALLRNKRPEFPGAFPQSLKEVIKKGWSDKPEDRPDTKAFHDELQKLDESRTHDGNLRTKTTNFTVIDQTNEVGLTTMPVTLISMQWTNACELENSKDLRINMVSNIRSQCNFKSKITASVLKAMEVVPRHLFMEPSRIQGVSTSDKIESAYTYNKAMGATEWSNESSPEIIGVQVD